MGTDDNKLAPIKSADFSGQGGFVVTEHRRPAKGATGVLGPEDEVRRLVTDRGVRGKIDAGDQVGPEVDWYDPSFAAARVQHTALRAEVDGIWDEIEPDVAKGTSAKKTSPESQLARLHKLAARLDSLQASPRVRSDVWMAIANCEGRIAEHTKFRIAKLPHLKRAFEATRRGVAEDPDNAFAGRSYATSILAVANSSMRKAAEAAGGFSVERELDYCISVLSRHAADGHCQVVLERVLQQRLISGALTREQTELLDKVAQQVATFSRAHPALAQSYQRKIDDAIAMGR